MPALADKSGARSGGLAAAPPTAIWRNKIGTRIKIRTRTTRPKRRTPRIKIKIRIRMMTAAILAGTIPTLSAAETIQEPSIHKRSAAQAVLTSGREMGTLAEIIELRPRETG